jgi:predicted amidohydrolase YtcJ
VLDRDYFTVPEVQIKQIRSVMTMVGGRVAQGALG